MRHRTVSTCNRTLRLLLAIALTLAAASTLAGVGNERPAAPSLQPAAATDADSLYDAAHPRLLFDTSDIPALYDKVRDGGYDDDAYSFIRLVVDYIYPGDDEATLLGDDYGLSSVPMLALATFLENPPDESARDMGRGVVTYLASHYDVDEDPYASSLRLRSLALGYDCFYAGAPESERVELRQEIAAYIDTMTHSMSYCLRLHRPYLSNVSAMVAASVGLAAIALDGETDPQRLSNALSLADDLIEQWTRNLVDTEGAYNEGVLYAGWSLRHLVYYFVARERFDGRDYGAGRIRKMERWFAYELCPEGNGRTHNLNDSGYMDDPLAQHHTYFDWAQWQWQSHLSAYLYEHLAGPYGWDWGPKADKPATALWNLGLSPLQPQSVLPPSAVWEDRGLFYCRSGWPAGASSNDLVLTFYSGKFQGGHAQEDQNQFTLQAYGAKLALDHGPGTVGKQSESHNIVFIDGSGQHNAGASIGTDGRISQYVLGGWCDFVQGDATAAYGGHSALNNPGYPFWFCDWSWGYSGANPVRHARRHVACVHGADGVPPYILIGDDIDKDGALHDYQWRLHTASDNSVDTSGVETRINAPSGRMIVHALNPARAAMSAGLSAYNNQTSEPDSRLLTFDVTAVNPRFSFLLFPGDGATPVPAVTRHAVTGGVWATIDWGSRTDMVVCNSSGGSIAAAGPAHVETDALVAVVRLAGSNPTRYLAAQAQSLAVEGTQLVDISNGRANVSLSDGVIHIDRYDADFTFYAPGVSEIRYRSQQLCFVEEGGYLRPDPSVGAGAEPATRPMAASAFPNPFNPTTCLRFELPVRSRVSVTVYDALGRPVRRLSERVRDAGPHVVLWDGTDEAGRRVPSGVYLARVESPAGTATVKLTLVK